jgi:hypothetical protein
MANEKATTTAPKDGNNRPCQEIPLAVVAITEEKHKLFDGFDESIAVCH